jgi:DNA-binding NarL/FixJ family response regulator
MRQRIVIVDDDDSFRKLLIIRLNAFLENPEYTEYEDLQSARADEDTISKNPPDLVILDQHLPDGKGIELLEEGLFKNTLVLAVSSDASPEMPGRTVSAGAAYFLGKDQVRSPLFQPLVRGVIERNTLQRELTRSEIDKQVVDLVRTHIGTLRHEINNPLGAVMGAAYLLQNAASATEDQIQAAELVEKSGKRIKHVLDQICTALEQNNPLQQVTKANQKVYHIPGDTPWTEE